MVEDEHNHHNNHNHHHRYYEICPCGKPAEGWGSGSIYAFWGEEKIRKFKLLQIHVCPEHWSIAEEAFGNIEEEIKDSVELDKELDNHELSPNVAAIELGAGDKTDSGDNNELV